MKVLVKSLLVAITLAFAASAWAASDDGDYQRLTQKLNELAGNADLADYAQAERTLARQTVERLPDAGHEARGHVLYMAERRVDLARAAAQLGQARDELKDLRSKHDNILLQASRRDAQATRRELEQERLQNSLAMEHSQRLAVRGSKARAQAEKARKLAESHANEAAKARHEAELAGKAVQAMRRQMANMKAEQGDKGQQMTLGGAAFASGQSSLRPEAKSHLGKLVNFVQGSDKPIRIVGYTDSTGNSAVNRTLSENRAQAVANALESKGVTASRMSVSGEGESNPVADNGTARGRAKNRRVVVILQDQ